MNFRAMTCIMVALLLLVSCSCRRDVQYASYEVIPLPRQLVLQEGAGFVVDASTPVIIQDGDSVIAHNASFLCRYLELCLGKATTVSSDTQPRSNAINLFWDDACPDEGYRLLVDADGLLLKASSGAGFFYGIQMLRKSLPDKALAVTFPAVVVEDEPSYPYRGMHLDLARHCYALDSLKIYVDMLAMHNMNRLHLHLTDDQGWRMEIERYPLLTEIGSRRQQTISGHNSVDTMPYEGYYSKQELRELVRYAEQHYVEIIPEIDLPGHQQAALASYPYFGCTGGPYNVWQQWGISDEVICAGNEDAMQFLEDVLDEVMDVFPSEYIHIGGDECPKQRWRDCPKCQNKIQELGLVDDERYSAEEYLQSYVIQRMQRHAEKHGRKVIGWDEVLEGGLADEVAVMCWRGIQGGVEAAREGHTTIMATSEYLYFNRCQGEDPDKEPYKSFGYVPIEKVYEYDPCPSQLAESEREYVVGAQGNIWTEYVTTFRQVQYLALPRMAALAEVLWSEPNRRDVDDFVNRCSRLIDIYSRCGYHYGPHIFRVKSDLSVDTIRHQLLVSLSCFGDAEIYYSLDGHEPYRLYDDTIVLQESAVLRAESRRGGRRGEVMELPIEFCKSTLKPMMLMSEPHPSYRGDGSLTLCDTRRGTANFRSGQWLGFWGTPLDVVVDMLRDEPLSSVRFGFLVSKNDWIYNPKSVTVLLSDDGITYREASCESYEIFGDDTPNGVFRQSVDLSADTARYVRVVIEPFDLPYGHYAFGNPAYIFIDEVEVL